MLEWCVIIVMGSRKRVGKLIGKLRFICKLIKTRPNFDWQCKSPNVDQLENVTYQTSSCRQFKVNCSSLTIWTSSERRTVVTLEQANVAFTSKWFQLPTRETLPPRKILPLTLFRLRIWTSRGEECISKQFFVRKYGSWNKQVTFTTMGGHSRQERAQLIHYCYEDTEIN